MEQMIALSVFCVIAWYTWLFVCVCFHLVLSAASLETENDQVQQGQFCWNISLGGFEKRSKQGTFQSCKRMVYPEDISQLLSQTLKAM